MSAHADDMLEKGLISSHMAKELSQPWYKAGVLEVKYDEKYLEGMSKLHPGYDPVVMPAKDQRKKADDDGEGAYQRWLEEGSDDEDEEEETKDGDDASDEGKLGAEHESSKVLKNDTKGHKDAIAPSNTGLKPQEIVPDLDNPDSDLSSIASDALSEMGAQSDDDGTDVEVVNTNSKKRQKKKAAPAERGAKRTKGSDGSKLPVRGQFSEMVQSFTYDPSNADGEDSAKPVNTPQKKKDTTAGAEAKPPRNIAPLKKKETPAPNSSPSHFPTKHPLNLKPSPRKRNPTPATPPQPTPYDQTRYHALLALCRQRNLPGKGRGAELRARLVEDDDNILHGRERKLNLTRKGGRRKGWVHDEKGERIDGGGGESGRRHGGIGGLSGRGNGRGGRGGRGRGWRWR